MTKDEALRLALDYLERHAIIDGIPARDAIREVLAQPEQEPVAWMCQEYRAAFMGDLQWFDEVEFVQPPNDPERYRNITPLYTSPPKREWVGLTHAELVEIYNQKTWDTIETWDYEQALEAKLKEKNT